jgi:membrane protein
VSTAEPTPSPETGRAARLTATGRRAADWARSNVPGANIVAAAFERQRLEAAGLLSGGLAYRLFFWLVPLGLVFAALLSFWVENDRVGLEEAASDYGIGGAAARSAMDAIARESHSKWYFLVVGSVLCLWFAIGVVRALSIAHCLAWHLPPEKLRTPLAASLVFNAIVLGVVVVSSSLQPLREQLGGTGIALWLLLLAFYVSVGAWVMQHLPSKTDSWRDHLPGALLLALGFQLLQLVVVLYLAPKLGRSSQLYGSLGAATVILLWLYLMARLVVAAAFLNASLWERRHEEAAA